MKYFNQETDPAINWDKVDLKALEMLETAREYAQVPFVITSHYRTSEHSVSVGGSATDAHTEIPCSAFDIACSDAHMEYKIVYGLVSAGFKRIGLNLKNNHIHVDNSARLPAEVLFIE